MDQFKFTYTGPASEDDAAELVLMVESRTHMQQTARADDGWGALTYDATVEMAQLMAPTPGIEGPNIGSGA